MRGSRIASVLLLGLSSCTLFGGLDGFSGAPDPGDGGGLDGPEARPGDGDDGGDGDGGAVASDAAAEDGSLPGVAPFSCAALSPPPTFCADFDSGGPINQGWDAIVGGIALDGAFAKSPPSSARVRATTVGASSYLLKSFAVNPTRARLEVDVRLDAVTADVINVVRLRIGGSTVFLRLTAGGAYLAHDYAGGYNQYSLSTYPRAETWIRVALHVEVGTGGTDAGKAANASLAFDGSIVAQRDIVLAPGDGVTVHVGIAGGKTTGTDADIRYDNVVVQLE